tara:strand:- start:2615 stop:2791 length:177 start_codon:yes stop_codon:yes gene_type:complete
MQVGDLVKVKRKHREDTLGLVVEVKKDDWNSIYVVQPINVGLQIYANPVDVEVISESR